MTLLEQFYCLCWWHIQVRDKLLAFSSSYTISTPWCRFYTTGKEPLGIIGANFLQSGCPILYQQTVPSTAQHTRSQNHASNSPYTTTCLPCWTYTRICTSTITLLFWLTLHQPRTNTVTASRAFAVAAPIIWNSLPMNYCTFETKLKKTHLFSTYWTKQQCQILVFNELWRYISF